MKDKIRQICETILLLFCSVQCGRAVYTRYAEFLGKGAVVPSFILICGILLAGTAFTAVLIWKPAWLALPAKLKAGLPFLRRLLAFLLCLIPGILYNFIRFSEPYQGLWIRIFLSGFFILAASWLWERENGIRFSGLITCKDDFQTLLRRFVKSDDYVMKDFLKLFLTAPSQHGILRYVTSYEGFTLADLVSYNERHNEANGEFGLDGTADNYSWNCGEEGRTDKEEVLALRRKQVRNFLTLLLLSRGTPMIWQGDERGNSQNGNNNAYCQDNEISWVDWSSSPEQKKLTAFAAKLAAFRKDHPIFTGTKPFQYIDYLGIKSPDVSLHGAEAWKPDLGPFSHSIGIAFCENYAQGASRKPPAFTYLALNMYWEKLSLALPKLPPNYIWKICMDTSSEEGFLAEMITPADQHFVETEPRSVCILRAVPDTESIRREKAQERLERLPSGTSSGGTAGRNSAHAE